MLFGERQVQTFQSRTIVPIVHEQLGQLLYNGLVHHFLLIAQHLAQWLEYNGQSAMPLEVAYEQVARALQRIPGRTPDEAPLILKTLVERSGLLREPNPDVVDFLHNTFKELLAGDDLAVRGDAESVVQHLDDESWRRVALFGVASPRSQTFADALVTRVLDHIRRMVIPARPASTLKSPNAKRTKTQTGKNAHPTDIMALKAACRMDKSLLRTVLFALQCRRVAAGTFLEQQLANEIDKPVAVPFPPDRTSRSNAPFPASCPPSCEMPSL